jgi:NodT family efflux transporter outer membrane factor (OMF) lipoprotein
LKSVTKRSYRRVLNKAGLLLGPALLAACAVGPDFKKPAAPDAQSYAPQPLPDTTATAAVDGGDAQHFVMGRDIPFAWWKEFGSPKLDALVEQALKNNPTITAAEASLRQAREMLYAQQGFFFPTLGGDFNATRQKVSGNTAASTAPGVQGSGQDITPSGPAQPLFYNFYTAQLNISYAPDIFGANRRKVESARAQAESQRFQMEAAYVSLADNVVGAVIQEAALQAQIKATQAYVDQNSKALDILHRQQQLGYAMGIDVATQESALAQAEQQLPPLQKQLEQTHDLVRALVGDLPDQDVDTAFDFSSLKLPQDLPLSLPSKLVEQRPDVRAAEEQWHEASANVGVAIADELPQFTISGALGGNASELRQIFSPGAGFWNISGDMAQTIFDGGTLLHTRRAADQAMIQAAAQYRSTVIGAFQNVADTLHAIQADADYLAASVKAEQAAQKAMTITEQQYKLGYVSFLVLLNAQETYQQALVTLVQAQSNRYGDTAALFQALGGGWWNRQQTALNDVQMTK